MGKKKQEMSQVYNNSNNEFIFGENGGKGKHLSSFLKNLSLTGTSSTSSVHSANTDNIHEINSNIYGTLGYSSSKVSSNQSNSGPPPKRSVSYKDLDDDWDADIDVSTDSVVRRSPDNRNLSRVTKVESNTSSRSSFNLQPSPMLDSLYPDLTLPATNSSVNLNSQKPTNEESLDVEDYRTTMEINRLNQISSRNNKFRNILISDSIVNLQDLRKLAWNGIPSELRALTWQILLGYLPTNRARQASTLKRKRQEYLEGLNASTIDFEDTAPSNSSSLYHQIKIDVRRTNQSIKLYGYPETQQSLRKLLYLWAVRHPASGYVQGINDLCTPFFQIFLLNYIWQLQQRVLSILEADTYWCLSRLLENITDNYIHEQPGIIRQVGDLRNLISKIDLELLNHLDHEGVEFLQFSFRWMNCLLMRELSISLIVRMWDTYLSETPLGFNNFHVYVCAAFLIKFSNDLKEKDFQEILLFLQNPPTGHWKEKDIELMLSEAFIWQSLYKNASAHLR
ncbi:GTPase-activating protein GYP1 [Scheffersomyces stipitis CBS 6054]|uniref:GTPase-activating protein GYP1 n=1 Tax=Scheffersomyces stipitis (strain ATCC 58785 / CBS 6054 / NBRC 10063 / NRRL Y-11545) TaxID=322104 RepID=A3LYP7_PICST|nr:GTPase-activating protein GYP1 [Scheffersomyces stipitis CBS 6054]ABN68010.1 GTPase-activating protein GYP1 [Scheffersomyces stipitis CBS 6054]